MRQNRVHLMPPMSNFYARICVKATPSSNTVRSTVTGGLGRISVRVFNGIGKVVFVAHDVRCSCGIRCREIFGGCAF